MMRWILLLIAALFFLGSAVYWRNQSSGTSTDLVIANIERNVVDEIIQLNVELQQIALAERNETDWPNLKNIFALSDSTHILKWNSNQFMPNPNGFEIDSVKYIKNGNSYWLIKSISLQNKRRVTGYLSLQTGFGIQNQFLTTSLNQNIFPARGVSCDVSGEVFPIKFNGDPIFFVSVNHASLVNLPDAASWILLMTGVVCCGILIVLLIRKSGKNNPFLILAFTLVTLLSIRWIMVYGNFPGTNTGWIVFDPKLFASSTFNDSIGNLLLNTIALLLFSVAAFYLLKPDSIKPLRGSPSLVRIAVSTFLLLLCFVSQLLPFLYLETLYHNSGINPDVAQQIIFDTGKTLAALCIFLSTVAGIIFLISFYRIIFRVPQASSSSFLIALTAAAILFSLYHLLTDRNYEIPILLTVINVSAWWLFAVNSKIRFFRATLFTLFLFEIFIFSLQTAFTIRTLSIERERSAMIKFGNTFLIERDFFGEFLLMQSMNGIQNDAFIQQQMANPFTNLRAINLKIHRNYLSSYFNRYEMQTFLFDASGNEIGNKSDSKLFELLNEYVSIGEKKNKAGLYLANNTETDLSNRYLVIIPIKFRVSGYIALKFTLRQVLPFAVFPKLLIDNRFDDYLYSHTYSFALFNKGNLISSAGGFNYQQQNFRQHLSNPNLYRKSISLEGFRHVAVESIDGQVGIVSKKEYNLFYLLTNFAFYFLISVMLLFVTAALYAIIGTRDQLSYSNRIRFYVYLAVVLPMVAMAITFLRLNATADEQRIEQFNVSQARNLTESLSVSLNDSTTNLDDEVVEQTKSAGADASVYSVEGMLLASSHSEIFSSQLISRRLHPRALNMISRANYLFTQDEQIGNLKFRNTYNVIRKGNGEIKAILSLPFFQSGESAEENLTRLASNILVVFVLVFIFFYFLSFIALNWLTNPLRHIASLLHRTTLTGLNKKLEWKSKDEIGALVKEYNLLVDNLETSKEALKKTQREATWREMAKQVAHEIKNPLTPIKLTLQQLEKAWQEDRGEKEKTVQSVKAVLKQVDILNDIASSFSAFAQMPEPKLERVDVNEILKEAVNLHREIPNMMFEVTQPSQAIWVMADKKILSRIFSNIILNASQANRAGEWLQLQIQFTVNSFDVLISFKDNGIGIEQEILAKIFLPYFSTKSTGTGLGLAIAKQGIDQIGGRIWCESIVDTGTQFFISLPFK